MKKYRDHSEWVTVTNGIATIGITKLIVDEIGDIAFIALPEVGKKIIKDEVAAVIESSKAAIDIPSPLTGEIVCVNESLRTTPDILNHDPEEKGWLYQIKPHDLKELEKEHHT